MMQNSTKQPKLKDRGMIANKHATEDLRRKGRVLSFVLIYSLITVGYMTYNIIHDSIVRGDAYKGISPWMMISVWTGVLALFFVARKGYIRIASYLTIALYLISTLVQSMWWGLSMPAGLLMYAFVIILSGILLTENAPLIMTGIISVALIGIGYQEIHSGSISVWKLAPINGYDIIYYIVLLCFTTVVAWLSMRQISDGFRRARRSEQLLAEERDMLEIRVEERTEEIRAIQIQRLAELHESAELGKIAQGIFHDIIGPLNTANLYLNDIQSKVVLPEEYRSHIPQLMRTAERMKTFVGTLERNVRAAALNELYDPEHEINRAVEMNRFKAQRLNTTIKTIIEKHTKIHGISLRFYQVVYNLIANALEAFEARDSGNMISIKFEENSDEYCLIVENNGPVIPAEILNRMFDTYGSTTSTKRGSKTGLGLSIVHSIVTKELRGSIDVQSESSRTVFTVRIPRPETETFSTL